MPDGYALSEEFKNELRRLVIAESRKKFSELNMNQRSPQWNGIGRWELCKASTGGDWAKNTEQAVTLLEFNSSDGTTTATTKTQAAWNWTSQPIAAGAECVIQQHRSGAWLAINEVCT